MNNYKRDKNFLYLTYSLIVEVVFTIIMVSLLFGFAKHFDENKVALIVMGSFLAISHFATVGIAIYTLQKLDKDKFVIDDYRTTAIWNSIFAGILIYPLLIALFAWKKSGYKDSEILEGTERYLIKRIELLVESDLKNDLSNEELEEIKLTKELQKKGIVHLIEGNEYVYDIFKKSNVINDEVINQLAEQYIAQVVELQL